MKRWLSKLAILAVYAGVAFWSVTLGLWVSDTSTPVRRLSVTAEPIEVTHGMPLVLTLSVDRLRSCPSRVERLIIDSKGFRYTLEDVDYQSVPGPLGPDTYKVKVPTPAEAAHGPAKLRTIVTSWCNPWHRLYPIVDSWELPINFK